MANTDNKCTFFGNLGKDVDLQFTPKGTAVAKFSMGVNHSVKKGDKWETETDWVNVTAYGNLAERVSKILQKGSLVYVEAQYRTFTWETKEGDKRYGHEFVMDSFKPLARLKEASDKGSAKGGNKANEKRREEYYDNVDDEEDEEF